MWLLIDDIRDLNCEVIARTPDAGRKAISIGGWECICFDHDLGPDSVKTGYDVMKWAFDNDHMNNIPRVQLVTSNPVGRDNMANLLLYNGYETKNNIDFYKKQQQGD